MYTTYNNLNIIQILNNITKKVYHSGPCMICELLISGYAVTMIGLKAKISILAVGRDNCECQQNNLVICTWYRYFIIQWIIKKVKSRRNPLNFNELYFWTYDLL